MVTVNNSLGLAEKEYGLIGKNISHSFSAFYFNKKFSKEGIKAIYSMFDISDIKEIPDILENHPKLKGFNVTSPYKRDIIPYLDYISDDASKMNAVNVVSVIQDGGKMKLYGYNTDSEGFRKSLFPFIKERESLKALILGTGGAASAVANALEKEGISYRFVSRSRNPNALSYEEASTLIPDIKLIVNASPVGMGELIEKTPDLDYSKISEKNYCYDLIYNPEETLFLKLAKKNGAKTKNGLDMLLNQAEFAWQIWNHSPNA